MLKLLEKPADKFNTVLAGPSYSEEPGPLLWLTLSQGEEDWALLLRHLVGDLSSGVEVHQHQHTCAHFNIIVTYLIEHSYLNPLEPSLKKTTVFGWEVLRRPINTLYSSVLVPSLSTVFLGWTGPGGIKKC